MKVGSLEWKTLKDLLTVNPYLTVGEAGEIFNNLKET